MENVNFILEYITLRWNNVNSNVSNAKYRCKQTKKRVKKISINLPNAQSIYFTPQNGFWNINVTCLSLTKQGENKD